MQVRAAAFLVGRVAVRAYGSHASELTIVGWLLA